MWVRRSFGAATAIAAGLVLSTTFGFLYVHSGRSANTDALFTLLTLLTIVTAWAAEDRPWRLCWLGPLAAALFMLPSKHSMVGPPAKRARGRNGGRGGSEL